MKIKLTTRQANKLYALTGRAVAADIDMRVVRRRLSNALHDDEGYEHYQVHFEGAISFYSETKKPDESQA